MSGKRELFYIVILCSLFIQISVFAQMSGGMPVMPKEKKIEIKRETDKTVTVVDSRGKEVILKKNPQRVLPIYTSYLNVWYECGGTAIARPTTEAARIPDEAKDIPQIGHVTTPDIEKVLSLKPDLVLLRDGFAGHSRIIPILEKMKISFLSLAYENYEDYLSIVELFTKLTGREDIRIDTLKNIRRSVELIKKSVSGRKKVSAVILFGSALGVVVKLPGSLVGSMVEELNGKNIAVSNKNIAGNDMQLFNMEAIVEKDPEVILIQTMGDIDMVKSKLKSTIISNPSWNSITAVKNRRVHYLPVNGFLYKPNKNFPAAYKKIAELLYPDLSGN